MKSTFLLAICFTVCVAANAFPKRIARDVSELNADNTAQIYLPPGVESQTEIVSEAKEDVTDKSLLSDEVMDAANVDETTENSKNEHADTVLGPQGYVYKTVRRLRLRTQRDVSHLNLEYLPPAIHTPATYYLPPIDDARKSSKLSNEYLPPVEPETEAPTTETPTTTTNTPETTTTTEAATTTTEIVTELPTTEAPVSEELVDDTAILAEDGYHYKIPDVVPDLSPIRDYLPPLDETIVVDEILPNDDSTVLGDDGYRYRTIKRFRF